MATSPLRPHNLHGMRRNLEVSVTSAITTKPISRHRHTPEMFSTSSLMMSTSVATLLYLSLAKLAIMLNIFALFLLTSLSTATVSSHASKHEAFIGLSNYAAAASIVGSSTRSSTSSVV